MAEWSDTEIEMARRMWLDGHSGSQIVAILADHGFSRTRNAIMAFVDRQGLKRGKAVERPGKVERQPRRRAVKAERPTPSPERVASPPAPPPEHGVTLAELERCHCRWVVADAPFRFCGQPAVAGTSWCEAHAQRVFSAAPAKAAPERASA